MHTIRWTNDIQLTWLSKVGFQFWRNCWPSSSINFCGNNPSDKLCVGRIYVRYSIRTNTNKEYEYSFYFSRTNSDCTGVWLDPNYAHHYWTFIGMISFAFCAYAWIERLCYAHYSHLSVGVVSLYCLSHAINGIWLLYKIIVRPCYV